MDNDNEALFEFGIITVLALGVLLILVAVT